MIITIYVNWDNQEIYANEQELVKGYLSWHGGEDDHFRDYLDENYESNFLFRADEKEKEAILKRYNEDLVENAKDWADYNGMINTIEI